VLNSVGYNLPDSGDAVLNPLTKDFQKMLETIHKTNLVPIIEFQMRDIATKNSNVNDDGNSKFRLNLGSLTEAKAETKAVIKSNAKFLKSGLTDSIENLDEQKAEEKSDNNPLNGPFLS
jgi:hypothetical protein